MSDKFNDDAVAKNDIINSPEVTEKTASKAVNEDSAQAVVETVETEETAVDLEKAERDARIVSKRFAKLIKDIEQDEAEALSDGAEIVFRFLATSVWGRALSTTMLFGAFGVAFLPRVIRALKRKQKEEEENNGAI